VTVTGGALPTAVAIQFNNTGNAPQITGVTSPTVPLTGAPVFTSGTLQQDLITQFGGVAVTGGALPTLVNIAFLSTAPGLDPPQLTGVTSPTLPLTGAPVFTNTTVQLNIIAGFGGVQVTGGPLPTAMVIRFQGPGDPPQL